MRLIRLCLVASLLLAACAPRAHAPPGDGPRVLVYNIHAGKDAAGVDNLARVAALIRREEADLVLLQEVDRGTERSGRVDQLAVLERLTGMHGAFGKTLDYQGGEYGIAFLSRWPIDRDSLHRLPVRPPQERAGGSYEPRGALEARISGEGGTLHLLNTHLDASRNDHYRLQEIEHVGVLARGVAGVPVLVGGDLNAEPGSEVIDRLSAVGWRDAWELCGSGEGLTFPASGPVKRIDYLFLPPAVGCRSARVIPTDASDHLPLLVVLEPLRRQ